MPPLLLHVLSRVSVCALSPTLTPHPVDACNQDAHASIRIKATLGLMIWGGAMAKIAHNFLREGGKYRYSFLTTKLENRWFWWELLLLARKTAIMACGLFNTSETARGWYCGSLVIIVALVAHAYARPFKDSLVDFTEFASLMSTLIIFQSGMVWNSSIDKTGLLSWFLEKLSIALVLVVASLGVIAQADAVLHNAHDSVHFSAKFVKRRSRRSLKRECVQLGIELEFLHSSKDRDAFNNIPEEVKELSDQLSHLGVASMVNSLIAFWTFEAAEGLLLRIRQLPESHLAALLFLENSKGRKKNQGVQSELEKQLMAVRLLRSRPVVRLAENITPAHRHAVALACQLATPQEFEEAIMVLERKQQEVIDIRQTLWRRVCCQLSREVGRGGASEVEWTDENPLHDDRAVDTDDWDDNALNDHGVSDGAYGDDTRHNERALAGTKQHMSAAKLRGISQVRLLREHFTQLEEQMKADSQTVAELGHAADQSMRLINEMMSTVIDENSIEAMAATCGRGDLNLEIRSLAFGPGSSVSIVEAKSGINALALFGTIIEEEGEDKNVRHYFRHTVRSTQGRAYGSAFTPYDFRSNPEQLVVLLDGRCEHTVEIAVNLPDVNTAVAHLHLQPWIQRNRDDENLRAAAAAATALAQKLTEEDPAGDDKPGEFMVVRCGCVQHNRLPRPLQTTAAIRRNRRFDAAIATLVHVLHQRFIGDDDDGSEEVGGSGLALAAMRIHGSTRRMDEVEGALEVSNTANVNLDFGAQPEQLDEADVGVMDTMGALDGMGDLDGV